MPLVKIKTKYQVTLPTELRKRVGVQIGDLLEARIERGKITLTPKTVIDRGIAESLEEFKKGRAPMAPLKQPKRCWCRSSAMLRNYTPHLHEIKSHPK